jgi:hypothetical protein
MSLSTSTLSNSASGPLRRSGLSTVAIQVQQQDIHALYSSWTALVPARYANLTDKYSRHQINGKMEPYTQSELRVATDSIDADIIGNNFSYFVNAMTIFCLTLDIVFDLKPAIAIALHAAKNRVCDEIDRLGSNYGTADNRSNVSFMAVMSDFISEMNQGYMLVCAQRVDTQQLIQLIDKYPDKDANSALWIKLNDIRYRSSKDSSAPTSKKNSAGGSQGKGKGAATLTENASLTVKVPSKKTTPCRFFPTGKCQKGDKCRFSHLSAPSKL